MKTDLNFELEATKKMLSKYDFSFFLNQNIDLGKYVQTDIDMIYKNYEETKTLLVAKAKTNKKQFNYLLEGKVRKMFTGGFLPALFELDETREHYLLDFPAVGENWAYFHRWQIYYKRKVTREKIWDVVIKTGSVLAILLSISKALELVAQYCFTR